MSQADPAVHELARLVEEASGNVVPQGHLRFLRELAARRARNRGMADVQSYVAALARGDLDGEWSQLLPLVTINESYFFRTPQHFRALQEVVLPHLLAARAGTRRLSVWSAGCARGEEPGTIAMVLEEERALAGWSWRVVATDVDEAALAEARDGVYSPRVVKHVPAPLLARYFSSERGGLVLSRTLLGRIDYRAENLVRDPGDAPQPTFDVIFLRNVLIYFRPESQRRVIERMVRSIAPDGVLFLGPAETLWQLSDAFEPQDLGDCFCYRLRSSSQPQRRVQGPRPGPARNEQQHVPPAPHHQGAPVRPVERRHPRPTAPPDPPRPALGERTTGRPDPAQSVAAMLRAGRLEEATGAVRDMLPANPTDPVLRTLEGLVHDLAGRAEEAAASYRAALFLEPSLFQTRLLLADTLRRLGWEARAQHEYRQTLSLLGTGRVTEIDLTGLGLPQRAEAQHRCRQLLGRGPAGPR